MKLFVAGLPSDFDDVDLKEMFELYGTVSSAKLITDRATGKSKGFGFVDMVDKTEALETIHVLNNAKIKGKNILVQPAEERPPNNNNYKPRDDYNRRY
jgi:RNA recognition motif-containing protein